MMYMHAGCILLFCLTYHGFEQPKAACRQESPSNDRSTSRRQQLVAALSGDDTETVLRAAEELALLEKLDKSARRALLQALRRGQKDLVFQSARFVDALAAAGAEGVPDLLQALKASDIESQEAFKFLVTLGRMGSSAQSAAPFLREKLKDPGVSAQTQAVIHVVLANLCNGGNDDVRAVLGDLARSTTAGFVARSIVQVRPGEWVNQAIIDELTKPFEEGDHDNLRYERLVPYTLALGMIGAKARSAAKALESAQKRAIADGHIVAVPITLAVARVDPEHQDANLRRLFRGRPTILGELERTKIVALLEMPRLLIDRSLAVQLADLVADRNTEVSEGAATLLWWAGLAANGAFPTVLKYVRGTAAAERRAMAADILERIATVEQLAELEVALKEETSQVVRTELAAAIESIRGLGKKKGKSRFLERYPFNRK